MKIDGQPEKRKASGRIGPEALQRVSRGALGVFPLVPEVGTPLTV
jgi:hypothetical protein